MDCIIGLKLKTNKNVNWTSGKAPGFSEPYQVKIRYRHDPAPARFSIDENDMVEIVFDEPQRAINPGQFAVIYDNEVVVGGGEICDFDESSARDFGKRETGTD